MKKLLKNTGITLLLVISFTAFANAQAISMGIHSGAPESKDITLKISSAFNYNGITMSGMFFIIKWPTDVNGINVKPANFTGYNGFNNTWTQSDLYPYYTTSGGYTYRIVDNNDAFVSGAAWNAPSAMNIVSFDMIGGAHTPLVTVELATDAVAQAMADTYASCTGCTYYSDINMGGPATVTSFSPSSVANISLPLKLTSFTAAENNCSAFLQWKTESEINTSHFDIEQSNDAVVFKRAGTVKAQGTGNGKAYSFTAAQDNSVAYYRLKMVDADGKYEYSGVQIVRTHCTAAGFIKVSPTLVNNGAAVSIIFKVDYKGKGALVISNSLGQKVLTRQLQIISGTNVLNLPAVTDQLNAGIYYLSLVDDSGNRLATVQKIVKL